MFSPKGDLYALPKGSSIIDFAYRVHSELGNHCIGGRVNGRMVQLKYQLANGDTVEVLTSPNQVPRREWLGMARTSKAQARVRAWLKGQQREKSVSLGRVLLEKELKAYVFRKPDVAHSIDPGEYKERMARVLAAFNLKEEEQLLAALGYGQVTVQDFLTAFFADSLSGWEADTEVRPPRERDNLLVRIHFIIEMVRWTGLAPWEFEFPFQVALHLPPPHSLTSKPQIPNHKP